ncbi:MAG: hypothetical protein IPF55_21010 [Rhodoferax sp.]|nr:hypothetical protein [Rhodoferax sp.]
MPEKRPNWSRLSQSEIERQRAVVGAKLRSLRAALRSRERNLAPGAVEASVIRQLRPQIAGLESTDASLRYRVSSARHAAITQSRRSRDW